MVVLLIIGTAVGVILGLRLTVFVLVPAMLLATAVTIARGIASGHDSRVIALAVLATLASVQIGYIVGCSLSALLRVRITGWHRRPKGEPKEKLKY